MEQTQQQAAAAAAAEGDQQSDPHLELKREDDLPHYLPKTGTGSNVVDGPGQLGSVISPSAAAAPTASATGSSSNHLPDKLTAGGALHRQPSNTSNEPAAPAGQQQPGSSYFEARPSASAGLTPSSASAATTTLNGHQHYANVVGQSDRLQRNDTTITADSSVVTPSTFTSSSRSPFDDHDLDSSSSPFASPDVAGPGVHDDSDLAKGIDELSMAGIQVVPSVRTTAAPAHENRQSGMPTAVTVTPGSIHSGGAAAPEARQQAPSIASSGKTSAATSASVRPAAPEQKKSMFGKLFSHKGDKDKHGSGDHSNDSSARASPVPFSSANGHSSDGSGAGLISSTRPGPGVAKSSNSSTGPGAGNSARSTSSTRDRSHSASHSAYTSGAESDSSSYHPGVPSMTRAQPSKDGSSANEKSSSGGFGSFLGRRSSNKKLEKPDATLAAMGSSQKSNPSTAASSSLDVSSQPSPATSQSTLTGPSSSSVNVATQGLLSANNANGPSSTLASRGSTPDTLVVPQQQRGTSVSPARPAEAPAASRGMLRRASGSSSKQQHQHDLAAVNGASGGGGTGTHTPVTDERHQVNQKSLKEHLAALGSSAGIGKLGRKSSQTSRRSDDGKSEKSHHGDHDGHVPGDSGYSTGPPAKPTRAPSIGGASNASSSLLKKYGVCEKVAIGKGATAVVRLAHKWDRSSEKLYAVKEFRKRRKNETEKEYVKKLTSEFCISSTLHHINVVETVDLVQNEEKHWCEVMEYCPGGDLYEAIKKGDMSTDQINLYFKQIVTGVAYLHSMGVAHRDIKPENLLLDGLGHVKITDFGVSDVFRMCWEKQTHMSKGLCGSEPYIAPEQFEQKEYDARLVDVWACAVVFYCMQAQELPWRVAKHSDPSFAEYLENYSNSPSPPPLGNLHPRECRAVIKKMLDPNPKTRIGMDAVLADSFVKSIEYNAGPAKSSTSTPNGHGGGEASGTTPTAANAGAGHR